MWMSANKSSYLRRLVTCAGVCFVIVPATNLALACSCAARTCSPRYSDVDFTGEVLSVKVVSTDGTLWGFLKRDLQYGYSIRVIESFRGPQKPGDVITVRSGMGLSDCSFHFAVGSKYLVDAWGRGGLLYTGTCGVTGRLDTHQAEIGMLRRVAAHQPRPSLFGVLNIYRGLPGEERPEPISGMMVGLKSVAGGPLMTSRSDAAGAFSFSDLPAGRYLVSLSLPPNLTLGGTDWGPWSEGLLAPITIEKGAGAICHAEIQLEPSGSIGGLVKSAGPFKGSVVLNLPKSDGTPSFFYKTADMDSDSNFIFKNLEPGRYLVHFYSKEDDTGRATMDIKGAQIINLGNGEQKTGVVLIAP